MAERCDTGGGKVANRYYFSGMAQGFALASSRLPLRVNAHRGIAATKMFNHEWTRINTNSSGPLSPERYTPAGSAHLTRCGCPEVCGASPSYCSCRRDTLARRWRQPGRGRPPFVMPPLAVGSPGCATSLRADPHGQSACGELAGLSVAPSPSACLGVATNQAAIHGGSGFWCDRHEYAAGSAPPLRTYECAYRFSSVIRSMMLVVLWPSTPGMMAMRPP